MEGEQLGAEPRGQFRDVREEAAIGRSVFEGDENFAIHGGDYVGAWRPIAP